MTGLHKLHFKSEVGFDGMAGRPKIAINDPRMVTKPTTVVTIKPLSEQRKHCTLSLNPVVCTYDDCEAASESDSASMITMTNVNMLPTEFAMEPSTVILKPYLLCASVAG